MKKHTIFSTLILTAFVLSGIPALAANSHRNILDSDHGQQKGSQKDSKEEGSKDQGQQKGEQKDDDKNDQGQQKASTAARNHGKQDGKDGKEGKDSKEPTSTFRNEGKGKQSLRF